MLPTLLLSVLLGPQAEPATELRFEAGHARVTLVQVPGAMLQTTMTFMPLGLLGDGPGRPQWAHLLEHMIIRTTDPEYRTPEGIDLNGETTGLSLRLDTYSPPAVWKKSLERHLAWMRNRDFDGTLLPKEQGRIAREEMTTVSRRATHKWALAAWNQVVIHGARHVALHGSVAGAGLKDVEAYAARRLPPSQPVHVVSVGPLPCAQVRAWLEPRLAALPASRPTRTPASRPAPAPRPAAAPAATAVRATWDLAVHHTIMWFPAENRTLPDRVAIQRLAGLLGMTLMQDPELRKRGVQANTTSEPGGTTRPAIALSASHPRAEDAPFVRERFLRAVSLLLESGQLELHTAKSLSADLQRSSSLDVFETLDRDSIPPQSRRLMEADVILRRTYGELGLGMSLREAARRMAGEKADFLRSRANRWLSPASAQVLELSPAGR